MASVGGFSPFGASGRSVSPDSPDYVFPMNPPVPPDGEAVEESLQGKETGKRRNSSKARRGMFKLERPELKTVKFLQRCLLVDL